MTDPRVEELGMTWNIVSLSQIALKLTKCYPPNVWKRNSSPKSASNFENSYLSVNAVLYVWSPFLSPLSLICNTCAWCFWHFLSPILIHFFLCSWTIDSDFVGVKDTKQQMEKTCLVWDGDHEPTHITERTHHIILKSSSVRPTLLSFSEGPSSHIRSIKPV